MIHAPQGFEAFKRDSSSSGEVDKSPQQPSKQSPTSARRSTPTATQESEIYVTPPEDDQDTRVWTQSCMFGSLLKDIVQKSNSSISPPPLQTSVPPIGDWSATPRAQSRQEMETSPQEERRKSSRSSSRSSLLAGMRGSFQ